MIPSYYYTCITNVSSFIRGVLQITITIFINVISVGCSRCKERLIFSRHKLTACNIFLVDIADYESPGTS
jgi:hypothetical protein